MVWLTFNDDATTDIFGNSFISVGTSSISEDNAISENALQLTNGNYLQSADKILIGGQNFTIDFYAYANANQRQWAGIFSIVDGFNSFNGSINFARYSNNSNLNFRVYKPNSSIAPYLGTDTLDIEFLGLRHHFAFVYLHSQTQFLIFVDGVLENTVSLSAEYTRAARYFYIGRAADTANRYFQGTIDEFRYSDGVARWIENFTPPTAKDYFDGTPKVFTANFQTLRKISKTINPHFQTERKVLAPVNIDSKFQTLRRVVIPVIFNEHFQTKRRVVIPEIISLNLQTKRTITRSVDLHFSTLRKIARTLHLNFQTVRRIACLINDLNLQSINIDISAQQLTDQLSFTATDEFNILQQVKGNYLDYVFNLRVESLRITDILSSQPLFAYQCCSDIDSLLYTQIAYTLSKTTWNDGLYLKADDETDDDKFYEKHPYWTGIRIKKTQMVEKPVAYASSHIRTIANILGKTPVLQFDDFLSTVDIEQEGVTYQDLISEIFGWTSRIPTKMINVFIRGDNLYVVQRGHELNVIDISNLQIDNIVISRSLYRTSFGVTRETTNLEKRTFDGYDYELVLGNEIPDGDDNPDDDEPDDDDDEPTEESRVLPSRVVTEENGVTTTIDYEYDEDGNVKYTSTKTESESFSSLVEVYNTYDTIAGNKYLSAEETYKYERQDSHWVIVDSSFVNHEYLTQGQQHISSVNQDGEINGSFTTPARIDDRPTPYEEKEYSKDTKYIVERDGNLFVGGLSGAYVYRGGKKVEVVGAIRKRNYKTISGTVEHVKLYDSSFPVSEGTAQLYTAELQRLNRTTQETATLDVYNHFHIFDLNDRIILFGNEYFVQSNSFSADSNIVNKQSLQLVRWC